MRKLIYVSAAIISLGFMAIAQAEGPATLRDNGLAIDQEPAAPAMGKVENKDMKQVRNYPEQPPLIPHKTRGYEITTNANKCLSCHSRKNVGDSQAPMVSVTHYMDRDSQVLATVSPRRYFCNQCHVTQIDAKPLVENTFTDVEDILDDKAKKQ